MANVTRYEAKIYGEYVEALGKTEADKVLDNVYDEGDANEIRRQYETNN